MANRLWVNLPVKDIGRSKAFYSTLGFSFNDNPEISEKEAHLIVDDTKSIVNLFEEPEFNMLLGTDTPARENVNEVLLTIDVESCEEVYQFAARVRQAGGTIVREQRDSNDELFGIIFADMDHHKWSVLFRKDKLPLIKSYFDGKDTHGHIKSA